MPPVRVPCASCEEAPLRELEADGELAGYVCSGASESELESRSGCGALISIKEYKEMKSAAEAKGKSSSSAAKSAATAAKPVSAATTPSRPLGGLGVRRPLASLHNNGRASLHTPAKVGEKASSTAASASAASAAVAASAVAVKPASSSSPASGPVSVPKPTAAKPAAAKPIAKKADEGSSSSSDSDDDDEENAGEGDADSSSNELESGEDAPAPGSAVAATPRKAAAASVSSTSTTPTKLPPSEASSPAKPPTKASKAGKVGAAGGRSKCKNNAAPVSPIAASASAPLDASAPRGDRVRALKAKLAAKQAAARKEFESKYGAEGDADTAEERANAARKGSGQAEEDFDAACSQGGGGDDAHIQRAPLLNSLSIKGAENPNLESHRKAWSAPRAFGSMSSEAVRLVEARQKAQFVVGRRLGARARIFPGAFTGFKQLSPPEPPSLEMQPPPPPVLVKSVPKDSDAFEPLVIWAPTAEELVANPQLTSIEVPHLVCKWLRPHQREGVKFMCECVLGQKNLGAEQQVRKPSRPSPPPAAEGETSTEKEGGGDATAPPPPPPAPAAPSPAENLGAGAILADDMGLGKTLQSVALMYTLLTQGFEVGSPVARKVVVVTPTSLVANWRNEIDKWLGKGVLNVVALSEVGKDNIECGLDQFTSARSKDHVLIVSYDTFRRHAERLKKPGLCDLLICDEAHRLKNNKTSTYIALDALPTKRRVLLSGTPMQNDLSEFFSMINFTNRRIIGDHKAFRKYYELPILLGREPEALEQEAQEGAQRSAELSAIVNQFVLRRTNVLLKKHLPPKVIQVVCCRPSALQVQLYQHFLASKSVRRLTSGDDDGEGKRGGGGGLQALPLITSLKKLCQHPKLIYDTAQAAASSGGKGAKGLSFRDAETGAVEKIPPALVAMFKGMKPIFDRHDGGSFARNPTLAAHSGKMFVLERLLLQVRASGTDRVVIVSNFTSALDVIAQMCQARRWDALRLDGSTSIKKRQQLVDQLSDHRGNKVFCFLLSSRAGGCGLNLIGANRLILFDPDWNPAVDQQAAARVWRDGQQKRCFIYRFLTTGTIEEKIYQRQLSKAGLSGVLGGSTADASLSKDELRDLFQLDQRALELPSDTHTSLACPCLDEFACKTEEEAAKADEAHKREAEQHAKEIAANAATNADDDVDMQPGAAAVIATSVAPTAAAAAASNPAPEGEDAAMVDGDGGEAEGETGGGDEGGEGGVPSSEDDNDDDDGADLDGFVVSGSDDEEGEEYGAKPKAGSKAAAKAKKPAKKDGPRKQRKKRSTVGSLNFPVLHALSQPTLGQRGEPTEEELINWAHHATSNSIPDPVFRTATKNMPLAGSTNLPYVSFVFSCEIAGKAIVGSSDAADAQKVSAICEAEPEVVAASKPLVVSAAEALAAHAEFMRAYTARQKKRAGVDEDEDMPDLMAHPELRRHSARQPKPIRNSATNDRPDAPDADDDFELPAGGNGAASSRKRKTALSAHSQFHPDALENVANEDDRACIQALLEADTKGGRGRPKKATAAAAVKRSPKKAVPPPPASEEDKMSDVEEEEGEEESEGDDDVDEQEEGGAKAASHSKATDAAGAKSAAIAIDSSSDVQEASPKKKKQRTEPAIITAPVAKKKAAAAMSEDSDDSSVQEVVPKKPLPSSSSSPALKPSAAAKAAKLASPGKSAKATPRPAPSSLASLPKPTVHKPNASSEADDSDDFLED